MAQTTEQDVIEKEALLGSKDSEEGFVIHIKTLNLKPFQVQVTDSTIVGDIKRQIAKEADAEGKFIRLIHQGKMLSDDSVSISVYKVKENDFLHCAISSTTPKQLKPSESITNSAMDDEDDEVDAADRRGFDRLRECMSREEVQALRLYFYPQVSAHLSRAPVVEGEATEDRIYRIEDEWMNSQGPVSEFALNIRPRVEAADYHIDMPSGSVGVTAADVSSFSGFPSAVDVETEGSLFDMVWGFLMGLLLGFILLFWLWERSVPRRQKLGIVLGVMSNIIISLSPGQQAHG